MNGDDELRKTYDSIAADFARRNAIVPENLAELISSLARHVGRDGLIIDVGCGHGRDTAWIERTNQRVVGFDLSFQMLKQAQRLTLGRLAQMDMKMLGLAKAAVDGIWCCAALLHLPKDLAPLALAEFRRVIRPGGMLIFSVQQGTFEGPRYSKQLGVTRYFSEYQPNELQAFLAASQFVVQKQAAVPGSGPGVWLQTIALAH